MKLILTLAFIYTIASGQTKLVANLGCIDYSDVRTLTGNSLAGVVSNGSKLLLLGGYYRCNKPKKGDISLYRWGDTINLAKIVKATSGDRIEIKKNKKNRYQLYINNKALFNASNEAYELVLKKQFGVINLHLGVVPEDMVLLLGESVNASNDSKRFGLVKVKYLAGRLFVLE